MRDDVRRGSDDSDESDQGIVTNIGGSSTPSPRK